MDFGFSPEQVTLREKARAWMEENIPAGWRESHQTISEHTDAGVSYSFTRSKSRFEPASAVGDTIEDLSRIRSDLHRSEFEIGYR